MFGPTVQCNILRSKRAMHVIWVLGCMFLHYQCSIYWVYQKSHIVNGLVCRWHIANKRIGFVENFRFFVDDVPIRVFKNSKDLGVRFPFDQPMKIYSSLWNADDWATRGGLEKTDWAKAPFVASYRGFHIDGCEASVQAKFCATQGKRWWDQKEFQDLDALQYRRLRWVRQKYTIYNYCTDRVRFPTLPPECKRDRDIWSYISNRQLTCELLDLHVLLSLFVYL